MVLPLPVSPPVVLPEVLPVVVPPVVPPESPPVPGSVVVPPEEESGDEVVPEESEPVAGVDSLELSVSSFSESSDGAR